jgi:hypothetical protein
MMQLIATTASGPQPVHTVYSQLLNFGIPTVERQAQRMLDLVEHLEANELMFGNRIIISHLRLSFQDEYTNRSVSVDASNGLHYTVDYRTELSCDFSRQRRRSVIGNCAGTSIPGGRSRSSFK